MGHITWILIRRQRSKIWLRPLTVLHRCERRTWKKTQPFAPRSMSAVCGWLSRTNLDRCFEPDLVGFQWRPYVRNSVMARKNATQGRPANKCSVLTRMYHAVSCVTYVFPTRTSDLIPT